MNRYQWLLCISLTVVIAIILALQVNTDTSISVAELPSVKTKDAVTAPVAMTDKTTEKTPEKNPPSASTATTTNQTDSQLETLWSTESVTTSVAIPEGVSNSQTVSLNQQALRGLQVGSRILLPTPTGEFAEASIERISYDALGNRLLEGSIVSNDTTLPVTITEGKSMTLASFTTESGEYALETRPIADCQNSAGECQSTGRVWQIPPLDQIIKPGSTDIVIPDADHL